MTTILNLYGGPGTGKSTSAAYLFYGLKQAGYNAELVTEYAKQWAWDKRPIGVYDQLYLLGKQIRKESMLYGKVDYLVTDSPILLASYYAQKYAPHTISRAVDLTCLGFYAQAFDDGHTHSHVFLRRSKAYNPAGRYQTEGEAKAIDSELSDFLKQMAVTHTHCGTHASALDSLLQVVLPPVPERKEHV